MHFNKSGGRAPSEREPVCSWRPLDCRKNVESQWNGRDRPLAASFLLVQGSGPDKDPCAAAQTDLLSAGVEKCVRSPWLPVREEPPLWLLGPLCLLTHRLSVQVNNSLCYGCDSGCQWGGWRSRVINYYVYPTVGEVSGIFEFNASYKAQNCGLTQLPMWEGEHEKALSGIDSVEYSLSKYQRIWRENYPCTISSPAPVWKILQL